MGRRPPNLPYPKVVHKLIERTGSSFNIIVIGASQIENDFFTIPYGEVAPLLTATTLTDTGRWLIHIEHGECAVFPGGVRGQGIDAQPYYGRRC